MNIYQRIETNQFALNRLFSKWRIQSEGLDGIREGYNRFGATFIGLVADVLNDHLSNYDDDLSMGPEPFNYDALTDESSKKSVWDALNAILGLAERGGDVLLKLKNGAAPMDYTAPIPTDSKSNNFLLIAAFIAIVIILFMVFKN